MVAGMDVMEWAGLADVFLLCDGPQRTDTILDFTPGVDRIDLSELSRLYSMDSADLQRAGFRWS